MKVNYLLVTTCRIKTTNTKPPACPTQYLKTKKTNKQKQTNKNTPSKQVMEPHCNIILTKQENKPTNPGIED
jgi:hypothetical protein